MKIMNYFFNNYASWFGKFRTRLPITDFSPINNLCGFIRMVIGWGLALGFLVFRPAVAGISPFYSLEVVDTQHADTADPGFVHVDGSGTRILFDINQNGEVAYPYYQGFQTGVKKAGDGAVFKDGTGGFHIDTGSVFTYTGRPSLLNNGTVAARGGGRADSILANTWFEWPSAGRRKVVPPFRDDHQLRQDATGNWFWLPQVINDSGYEIISMFGTAPRMADDGSLVFVATGPKVGGGTTSGVFVSNGGGVLNLVVPMEDDTQVAQFRHVEAADNGTALISYFWDEPDASALSNFDIEYYAGPENRERIASTEFGSRKLGQHPGMTRDGSAVAYWENTQEGRVQLQLYVNHPEITTLETVFDVSFPLNFDEAGAPIRFEDIFYDEPVSVVRQNLYDQTSLIGDSFIIAFKAKPERGSILNPSTAKTTPLLFSEEPGIWTIRVDVERELNGSDAIVFNADGVLPVIQVGDKIEDGVIEKLVLQRSLAVAWGEPDGTDRFIARGDHYLAFGAVMANKDAHILRAAHLDTDGDGLLDHWEEDKGGIDMDRDGTVDLDLHELGADPRRKDLFLEIDWFPPREDGYPGGWTNGLHHNTARHLIFMFAFAPVPNPNGTNGISVHVDAGPGKGPKGEPYSFFPAFPDGVIDDLSKLAGGDQVRMPDGDRPDMIYFGNEPEHKFAGLEVLTMNEVTRRYFMDTSRAARELAFRYIVLADYASYPNFPFSAGRDEKPLRVDRATSSSIFSEKGLDLEDYGVGPGDIVVILDGRGRGQIRNVESSSVYAENDGFSLKLSGPPLSKIPEEGDRFALLRSAMGMAENFLYDGTSGYGSPANSHSLPGGEIVVALGQEGPNPAGILGTALSLRRTIAHEIGHTLGLRHGGHDNCNHKGDDFLSIMSYSHVDRSFASDPLWKVDPPCSGQPRVNVIGDHGHAFPTVNLFSDGSDTEGFDEWSYLRFGKYRSSFYLGNSGLALLQEALPDEDFGPDIFKYVDSQGPTLTAIHQPDPREVPLGGDLQVDVEIEDPQGVEEVTITFDLNGDGIADPAETLEPEASDGTHYRETFTDVGGSEEDRFIVITATDSLGNFSEWRLGIRVGSLPTYPDTTGPSISPYTTFPLSVPLGNDLAFRFLTREFATGSSGPMYAEILFDRNGDGSVDPVSEVFPARTGEHANIAVWNAVVEDVGGAPGVRTATLRAYDRWWNVGTRTLDIQVYGEDGTAPAITIDAPAETAGIELGTYLDVDVTILDAEPMGEVVISFDRDGDGEFAPYSEEKDANDEGGGRYSARFFGVSGTPGFRPIKVYAEDLSGAYTEIVHYYSVGDSEDPEVKVIRESAPLVWRLGTQPEVEMEVGDDGGIDEVLVEFDLNGDGDTDDAGESAAATPADGNTYSLTLGTLTGPEGERRLTSTVTDSVGKTFSEQIDVRVVERVWTRALQPTGSQYQDSTLSFTFHFPDDAAVTNITARLDVDGNGTLDAEETVPATQGTLENTYRVSFSNLSGGGGTRTLQLDIVDPVHGDTTRTILVEVAPGSSRPGMASEKLAAVPSHVVPATAISGAFNDIGHANPNDEVQTDELLFFTAHDDASDDLNVHKLLFRSDGTPEGTFAVGPADLNKTGETLHAHGDMVYFIGRSWPIDASTSGPNLGLWRSDGTVAGTGRIRDLPPDEVGLNDIDSFASLGPDLYFVGGDNGGIRLWRTDGTAAGTVPVTALPHSEDPYRLATLGDRLVFVVNDSELWTSDGTAAGTGPLVDIHADPPYYIFRSDFVQAGEYLFFFVVDFSGWSLWRTDGTAGDTLKCVDLEAQAFGTGDFIPPENLRRFGDQVVFSASPALHESREPWISNGTPAGTRVLKDVYPGGEGSDPAEFVTHDGTLYFAATSPDAGRELWQSDGTEEGTRLVADFVPKEPGSHPLGLRVWRDKLYFSAGTPDSGRELCVYNPLADEMSLLVDLAPIHSDDPLGNPVPESSSPTVVGLFEDGFLFKAIHPQYGYEMFRSDGTASGTGLLRNIRQGIVPEMRKIGSVIYLAAGSLSYGHELWAFAENRLQLVEDLSPGMSNGLPGTFQTLQGGLVFSWLKNQLPEEYALAYSNGLPGGILELQGGMTARPHKFFSFPHHIFFSGYDDARGTEPWVTDGTVAGTQLLGDLRPGASGSLPSEYRPFGGEWIFAARSADHGEEPWMTDGTPAGTRLLKDIHPGAASSQPEDFTPLGGQMFFRASDGNGHELWKTDGTEGGTSQVLDLHPTEEGVWSGGNSPSFLESGGTLFFSGATPETGAELFTSDGTPGGTMIVKDLTTGFPGLNAAPHRLTRALGEIFFVADNGQTGWELYASDGTGARTRLVKDIWEGGVGAYPDPIAEINSRLVFTAEDEEHGRELWSSDGTESGTRLLADIFPGTPYREYKEFTVVGGKLYFSAFTYTHGRELWVSDGTPEGTYMVEDLVPGPESSNPHALIADGDRLLYIASDGGADLSLRSLRSPNTQELFEAWMDGLASLTGGHRDLMADKNGNGLTNLAEYALGGQLDEPSGPIDHLLPVYQTIVHNNTSFMEIQYRRRKDAALRGLSYQIRQSWDLKTWQDASVSSTQVVSIDADFEWVTARIPMGAWELEGKVFFGVFVGLR